MGFRHDTSFPYFAIACEFNEPYARVLALANHLNSLDAQSRLWLWLAGYPDYSDNLYWAIHHAWHAEDNRRRVVTGGGK